jgi:prevent-host-death family protein
MAEVTMRELRNEGGKVIDRVEAGETFIVTRDGRQVAELRPIERHWLTTAEAVERLRSLPRVDPVQLRKDIDSVIDPSVEGVFDRWD